MCYIVVVLRDMVKERWWSATDIKHRKHVKTCYLWVRVNFGLGFRDNVRVSVLVRVRVSLGFRDRVRVKVRVSFRLATFMYSVWPPVSLRVSLGLGLELRSGSVLDSPLSCILYVLLYPICKWRKMIKEAQ